MKACNIIAPILLALFVVPLPAKADEGADNGHSIIYQEEIKFG